MVIDGGIGYGSAEGTVAGKGGIASVLGAPETEKPNGGGRRTAAVYA